MLFFILFIIIPVLEIATFIAVADEIGFFLSLLLIILSGIIGAAIIRIQGVATVLSLRPALLQSGFPAQDIFDAICITLAGILFIIPGFLSDIAAIFLLIPPIRYYLCRHLPRYITVWNNTTRPQQGGFRHTDTRHFHVEDPDIIDGEYERVEEQDEKQ